MSFSNSRLMDSAWARITGTRMQVAVMATSFSPQILAVSLTCSEGGRGLGHSGSAKNVWRHRGGHPRTSFFPATHVAAGTSTVARNPTHTHQLHPPLVAAAAGHADCRGTHPFMAPNPLLSPPTSFISS